MLYICDVSVWNHATLFSSQKKNSFIGKKNSKSFKIPSWLLPSASKHFPKLYIIFLSLFQRDGTISISSIYKAELSAQAFAKNSTLDDSVFVSCSPAPFDNFRLPIKILSSDVFHALPVRDYQPESVLPCLRNCASMLASCQVKLLQPCLSPSIFFLPGTGKVRGHLFSVKKNLVSPPMQNGCDILKQCVLLVNNKQVFHLKYLFSLYDCHTCITCSNLCPGYMTRVKME